MAAPVNRFKQSLKEGRQTIAVSYTHLTLPTTYHV